MSFGSVSYGQWGALVRTVTPGVAPEEVSRSPSRLMDYPDAVTDQKMQKQLESLVHESGWYNSIKVRVKDGIITLEGSTKSRDHLRILVEASQRLPHAVAVINKVDVQSPVIDNFEPVWQQLRDYWGRTKQLLPIFLITILVMVAFLFFGNTLNRTIRAAWRIRVQNPFLLALVSRLTLIPIWILVFYFALRLVGVPNVGATIIGGTGFLTLFLVLAFKGIAENYLAGLLLASRSPFTRGDLIKIGEYQGYVQNLNMRGTTIIDFNGNLLLIPNIMVIQSVVENRSANPSMRTTFLVHIGYQESISKVQDLIIEGLTHVEGVLQDPAPTVTVEALNPSSVQLRVQVWLNANESTEARVKSRAMIRTKDTLLVNGINIPDEAREVVFADSLKVHLLRDHEGAKQDRKNEMQRAAAYNLEDSKQARTVPDVRQEKLMDLAQKNPLPINRNASDLLDQSKESAKASEKVSEETKEKKSPR